MLASATSTDSGDAYNGPVIDVIPAPVSEEDAYKQDVAALPESATLEDYERVPVSQFGAALLRGMGWKEGEVASKSKRFQGKGQDGKTKGLIEPWIPTARPALLGIGAKEKEAFDDGSGKKGKGRPDKRYVPVLKVEKNGSGELVREGESRSGSSSRRRSPEPSRGSSRRSPSPSDKDRRRDRDRDYEKSSSRRDRDRDDSNDDRSRRKDKDRGSDRDRRRDYDDDWSRRDRERTRDRDRDYDRRKDKDRSPDRERYADSSTRRKDRDRRDH